MISNGLKFFTEISIREIYKTDPYIKLSHVGLILAQLLTTKLDLRLCVFMSLLLYTSTLLDHLVSGALAHVGAPSEHKFDAIVQIQREIHFVSPIKKLWQSSEYQS